MHIKDTAGSYQARSCAVSQLIGDSLRSGDVDSVNDRSTRPTTPGTRTSTMATRTRTTRTTKAAFGQSADYRDAEVLHVGVEVEQWRVVTEFPAYEVSNRGRVRRGTRVKQAIVDRKGYLFVTLWDRQRRAKLSVSRLVAAAFIGPRPDGLVVRHKNGINNDNRDTNLCYGTYVENEADKIAHGTKLTGQKHPEAKLTEQQVRQIRARYKPGSIWDGGGAIAAELGVSRSVVSLIVNRKLWREIA